MSDLANKWIIVRNWDKFQHYKDRNPTWIKLYTELEYKHEWTELSLADQGLLIRIWMQFALASGRLHVGVIHRSMPPHSTIRALRVRLDRLENLGFITVSANAPLAQRREEKEKRREKPRASAKTEKPRAPADRNGALEPVHVDEAMLKLAKNWISGHD